MDMFVVQGSRRLAGRVAVSGAKNAALPIMAATILADGPSVLWGVPDLADVRTLSMLLQTLGMNVLRGAAGESFSRRLGCRLMPMMPSRRPSTAPMRSAAVFSTNPCG